MMKRNLFISLALALTLSITAAAASAVVPETLRIGDYIRLCEFGEIPESFDTGFNRTVEAELNGVLFRVVDAYATPSHAIILTEIRMADGSQALFREDWTNPDVVCMDQLQYGRIDEDPRTLREYASEKNLPIISVSVGGSISESSSGTNNIYLQDDFSAISVTNIWYRSGSARTVDASVDFVTSPPSPYSSTGKQPDTGEEIRFMKLPVSGEVSRFIPVGQTVSTPFGPVTLDSLTIRRSPIETIVDTAFYLNDLGTDVSAIPEELREYSFTPVDTEYMDSAWKLFSTGANYYEQYGTDPENQRILFFRNCSVSISPEADTLTLAFIRNGSDAGDAELLTVSIPKAE